MGLNVHSHLNTQPTERRQRLAKPGRTCTTTSDKCRGHGPEPECGKANGCGNSWRDFIRASHSKRIKCLHKMMMGMKKPFLLPQTGLQRVWKNSRRKAHQLLVHR
ncbi:hypothetical protein AMELA_G00022650 [Ameiurus melas]|uniref:Uncharacterized protein n=1 Tax=Ameiurus melas TaxID=219545 RepID=A0A7J6BFP8_AMEME|nr:hypothetical protein AMELA_G00022650 [Ameiurus melas]